MIRSLTSILLAVAACGGKPATPATATPAAAPPATPAAHDQRDPHDEMAMPPELAKFHDVMAPRWHAEKGPQRMTDTCAALPDLHADADALAKSTPPRAANADTWTAGTKHLVEAVAGLESTCKSKDSSGFETAFGKVHASFHGLLEASGAGEGHPM